MATFSPSNNTHLEFNNTNQTVTLVHDGTNEYTIQNVSYVHENNVIFDDMKILWSGNSFTYKTQFANAVNRKAYYTIVRDQEKGLVKETVDNLANLPEGYEALYQVDNPATSTIVTFTVDGLTRHLETSTDSTTGTTTEQWSEWSPFPTQYYNVEIETNFDKHMQLVREYVSKGKSAVKSEVKPF